MGRVENWGFAENPAGIAEDTNSSVPQPTPRPQGLTPAGIMWRGPAQLGLAVFLEAFEACGENVEIWSLKSQHTLKIDENENILQKTSRGSLAMVLKMRRNNGRRSG